MSALLRASLHRRLRSWVGLTALLAIAAAAVSTGLAVRGGASAELQRIARRAGAPDLVLWGRPAALQAAVDDPAVLRAGRPRAITSVERLDPDGGTDLTLLQVIPEVDDPVSRLVLSAGRRPGPAEVVVEPGLGVVGGTIELRRDGVTRRARISGIGTDLSMCGAPTCSPGRIFVSAQTFSALTNLPAALADQSRPYQLRSGPSVAGDVGARLVATHPGEIHRQITWSATEDAFLGPDTYLGGFVTGIGGFLLLASLVVVAAVVTARLAARRRELATYAALGASPRRVAALLAGELLVTGMAGSVAGWLLAAVLAPWTRALASATQGTVTRREALRPADLVRAGALVLAGLALVTGWAIVGAARREVVAGLREDAAAGRPRWRRTFSLRGVVVPLGLQDPATRPLRSVLCLLGLVIATSGAVVGVGISRTVDVLVAPATRPTPQRDVTTWSTDDRSATKLADAVRSVPGAAHVYTERTDTARAGGRTFTAIAQDVPARWSPVAVVAGRAPQRADEAVVGYGMLGERGSGWRLGQRVAFDVDGVTLHATLVGSIRDVASGGSVVRYPLALLRAQRPDVAGGVVEIVAEPGISPRVLRERVQQRLGDGAQVFAAGDPSWLASRTRAAVAGTVLLLLGVALSQLASAWLTSLREQRRDLAVLHAMGATSRQLVGRSAVGAALVGGAAVAIGLPLGSFVLTSIGRSVADARGLGPDVINAPGLLPSSAIAAIICALSIAVAGAITAAVLARRDLSPLRSN